MRSIMKVMTSLVLFPFAAAPAITAETQRVKPEGAGISSERLQRIHYLIQRNVDAAAFRVR